MSEVTPTYQKLAAGEIEQLIRDDLIKELKEYHNKQLTSIIIHPKLYHKFNKCFYKKIKRRLSYQVIWWESNCRKVKYFESAKRMRKFVNHLHSCYDGMIEIEKTFCYREHSPRHKWHYYSWKPNQFFVWFICVERY